MISAVSELLSDVLGAHFPDFPLEDDVHVTLAGVEPAAFRIVVAFAYGGIADIPRNSVESVCEVAQLLKVEIGPNHDSVIRVILQISLTLWYLLSSQLRMEEALITRDDSFNWFHQLL